MKDEIKAKTAYVKIVNALERSGVEKKRAQAKGAFAQLAKAPARHQVWQACQEIGSSAPMDTKSSPYLARIFLLNNRAMVTNKLPLIASYVTKIYTCGQEMPISAHI